LRIPKEMEKELSESIELQQLINKRPMSSMPAKLVEIFRLYQLVNTLKNN
jgi:hypothetical protein